MMTFMAALFVTGYLLIALEHPLRLNKSAVALFLGGLLWTLYAFLPGSPPGQATHALEEKLAEIAAITFFLIGAMSIVEVTDAHGGFEVITRRITTQSKRTALWILCALAFFLSAILDNMTTTIILVTLIKKIIPKAEDRLLFASMVVIAANSGGAFSPIGDVTTTMLWIGGQITTVNIIKSLFFPSLVSAVVPLLIATLFVKGNIEKYDSPLQIASGGTSGFEKNLMFLLGLGALLFVPIFKTLTHLPPWLGILFALGFIWVVGEVLHRGKSQGHREPLTLARALTRIDLPSITFFIGILLSVGVFSATGQLLAWAGHLRELTDSPTVTALVFGFASAVVDNIPMVAAAMGMFPLTQYPPDHFLWEFIAYTTGTGGSLLIIGSAAGVAAMGLEKIPFLTYLKRVSPLAFLGFISGAAVYMWQYHLTH